MPELPTDGSFSKYLYQNERNRRYLVIKGNRIVQNTHYTMSLADQKILASLIRSIKPGQKSLTVKFSTQQYINMLGLRKNGNNFDRIKKTLRDIADSSFYIQQPDGSYDLWQWLNGVHANPNGKGRGNFVISFKPYLRKYLFNRSLKYRTIFKYNDIMLMQSRYSPRLYEIFRSNQSRQKIQKRGLNYTIFELRYALNLMKRSRDTGKPKHDKKGNLKFKYPSYYEFKRNVLKPAFKEINYYTEYNIKVTPIHAHSRGRKVVGINVVLLHKNQKELTKRDDLIYFKTHHIPKSQWKNWRENKIRGTFHKIHPRKNKDKVVDGTFHIVHSKQNDKLRNYLHKHPTPMRIVNMGGDKVCYYSPLVHKYIWTNRKIHDKQKHLYDEQQEMIKKLNDKK